MPSALLGIGTAVPAARVTLEESITAATSMCAETREHADMLGVLYRQSGIEGRNVAFSADEVDRVARGVGHCDTPFMPKGPSYPGPSTAERMARYAEYAAPLAIEASRHALEASSREARRVTHLVTVSCTGFAAPGFDIALIKALGLRSTVERTHVGFMGCHGALNGLRVARGLVAADPTALVLVCAVELCSVHYHYGWDPKRMVGNALFADGAGAVVVAAAQGTPPATWRHAASGACLFPDSEPAMAWNVGDRGFSMTLSTKVPGLIQRHLRPWLDEWLAHYGCAVDAVASWAVHPGGPRVLNGIQEVLGLAPEAIEISRAVLRLQGNMSSATVLFILREMMRRGAARPCVALGFGPGLAAEAMLLT
jgi:predicted naringenin-chalcone synthase